MDGPDDVAASEIREQAGQVAPVIWLLGKVQSGKTSIVRALTKASRAEIGQGLRACTKTADVFDFPSETPLIRFLDTRGLGEAGYDPADDIATARTSSHATIAVMRALDPQQDLVLEALNAAREADPDWPILIAQTHLHEGYPIGANHPLPYPFPIVRAGGAPPENLSGDAAVVPADLRRALGYQRSLFDDLPGDGPLVFVPIDFTLDDDGYEPTLYGLRELQDALAAIAPDALGAALEDAQGGGRDSTQARELHRLIVGHATAASAADLIPLAALAAVPAVQARLLHTIAQRFDIQWNRRHTFEFAAALGAGFVSRYAAVFGIRQLTKLIPVYGQTIGTAAAAATSFATTYALGKAAIAYLDQREHGQRDTAQVRETWKAALQEAFDLARLRGLDSTDTDKPS